MVGKRIQTYAFERARSDPIAVAPLDDFASSLRQPMPERAVSQQAQHRLRLTLRVVATQEVLTVAHTQALDSDGGRHHRTAHRHCFECLDSRAASNPKRDDRNLSLTDIWPDIVDKAGEGNTGV
jgi:hypothetical protein